MVANHDSTLIVLRFAGSSIWRSVREHLRSRFEYLQTCWTAGYRCFFSTVWIVVGIVDYFSSGDLSASDLNSVFANFGLSFSVAFSVPSGHVHVFGLSVCLSWNMFPCTLVVFMLLLRNHCLYSHANHDAKHITPSDRFLFIWSILTPMLILKAKPHRRQLAK